MSQLDPNVMSDVLRRAQEIQSSGSLAHEDIEEYLVAAEEAGIPREATLQALRERLGYPTHVPAPGEYVFARSVDRHFYMAKLESVHEQSAVVRFTNGATATVSLADLRDVSLSPGQRLSYFSPSMNMWVNMPVVRFNRDSLSVSFNYWGTEETVPIDKVRLLNNTPLSVTDRAKLNIALAYTAVGAGVLGFVLGWFLKR